jgi:predicted DNA-binding transcriptional regulator YafY
MSGGSLTYRRLTEEFLLERRTAERYLKDLKAAGVPVEAEREGREAVFRLAKGRSKDLKIEALDVPPAAARSLSLLLVAAALLPAHLGVREAVDATVRAALRLRGLKAAGELRQLEDAVIVLENDAKDYRGTRETFSAILDATLAGEPLSVRYASPQRGASLERFWPATVGLYRGGLYVLAVDLDDDGSRPRWRALERVETVELDGRAGPLDVGVRLRAIDEAGRRWGPARSRDDDGGGEQVITLHFSPRVAPYVRARPWHARAEVEPWPEEEGGGVRMALRLSGETVMFESWVRSWGPEVRVLRPRAMAERIATSLEEAARGHREAASAFAEVFDDD